VVLGAFDVSALPPEGDRNPSMLGQLDPHSNIRKMHILNWAL
jgi:hypothetical protein